MTAKENVLSNYPKAKLVKNIDKDNVSRGYDATYYLVSWQEQSIEQFMRGYANTEEEAWNRAWESIQKQLLSQFENS